MGHDTGLALIYGPVIGAWFYPIALSACSIVGRPKVASLVGLVAATIATPVFVCEFLRLDGVFRRLKTRIVLRKAVRQNPHLRHCSKQEVATWLVKERLLEKKPALWLVDAV